jgi:hypothetical protein
MLLDGLIQANKALQFRVIGFVALDSHETGEHHFPFSAKVEVPAARAAPNLKSTAIGHATHRSPPTAASITINVEVVNRHADTFRRIYLGLGDTPNAALP